MVEKPKRSFSESLRRAAHGDRESLNFIFARAHGVVDHARAKKARKRGGDVRRETLSLAHVDVHEALEELAGLSTRQAQVAELRFFGGLSMREVAEVLSIAESTVKDHRDVAKVWLKKKLKSAR